MAKTIFQSVAWFKRYKTLKSVAVGSLKLRKFPYSAKTRSAFGLARNKLMHATRTSQSRTLLGRLCGRLDDIISEPSRAVGAMVTEGTVILIGLPRMAIGQLATTQSADGCTFLTSHKVGMTRLPHQYPINKAHHKSNRYQVFSIL